VQPLSSGGYLQALHNTCAPLNIASAPGCSDANDEHVAILKQGVTAWNAWRKVNPDVRPDLSEADLSMEDLRKAKLDDANLREANLSGANLTGAEIRDESNVPNAFLFSRRSPLFTRFRPSGSKLVLATTGLGGSARQMSASIFHPSSGRPDCVAEVRSII
jgi:hypothetical protein